MAPNVHEFFRVFAVKKSIRLRKGYGVTGWLGKW
jgi:hypothetical protein